MLNWRKSLVVIHLVDNKMLLSNPIDQLNNLIDWLSEGFISWTVIWTKTIQGHFGSVSFDPNLILINQSQFSIELLILSIR